MKKGLTIKYLKERFYREGKTKVIIEYLDSTENDSFRNYQYTKGANVWVDTIDTLKAYSNDGMLFAIILKDNEYLEDLWENHSAEIIDYLDNLYDQAVEETEENENGDE